jgi:hypothetical protein
LTRYSVYAIVISDRAVEALARAKKNAEGVGTMTKKEAVQKMVEYGISKIDAKKAINKVEAINCEPTNRVLPDGDERTEWSASITIGDITLIAYYYTTPADEQLVDNNGGDWGAVDWAIDHYTII